MPLWWSYRSLMPGPTGRGRGSRQRPCSRLRIFFLVVLVTASAGAAGSHVLCSRRRIFFLAHLVSPAQLAQPTAVRPNGSEPERAVIVSQPSLLILIFKLRRSRIVKQRCRHVHIATAPRCRWLRFILFEHAGMSIIALSPRYQCLFFQLAYSYTCRLIRPRGH